MKKIFALLFWVLLAKTGFSQENYRIYSWEMAKKASPDTIYGISFRKMKLESLPEELLTFKKLKTLDISRNKFTEIPAYIFSLNSLEKLVINRNRISKIPLEIEKLQQLSYLDFWDNPISDFPEAFLNMTNLKIIHAEGIKYGPKFQEKWITSLPQTKLFFDPPCDCRE